MKSENTFDDSLLHEVNTESLTLSGLEKDKRYDIILANDDNIEIKFANGKYLSSMLPEGMRILNTPEANVPESRTHYDEKGVITNVDIALNYEWLKKSGERGLSILCHELGHPFVVPQTNARLTKLETLYFFDKKLPKNRAETVEDVMLATQYSMQELGINLEKELLAWDYGKSYRDLFGISDEIYEGSEERSIKGYVHDWTLSVRKGLERYAANFGTLDNLKETLHGEVLVYDTTTRSYIRKPFSEVIEYLNTFNGEEADRLNNIASSEGLITASKVLAEGIKDAYEHHFREAIGVYRKEIGPFPNKMEAYLEDKDWFKPSIDIVTAEQAKEKLTELGFPYEADSWDEKDILMVFNLPKPLTQYWNKYGTEEHPQQTQDINGMALEWGYFYRTLANIPWDSVGQFSKTHERMEVNRINRMGQHGKEYYYLFRITEYTPKDYAEMQAVQEEMGLELENGMKAIFEKLKIGNFNQDEVTSIV